MNKDKIDLDHNHDDECGCGHDHDHNGDMEIITLTLDDGSEVECGIIGLFEVEDKEYIALLELVGEEVLIFSYTEDEEGFSIAPIEYDEEFDLVVEAYYALFADILEDEYEDFELEDFDLEDDEEE